MFITPTFCPLYALNRYQWRMVTFCRMRAIVAPTLLSALCMPSTVTLCATLLAGIAPPTLYTVDRSPVAYTPTLEG